MRIEPNLSQLHHRDAERAKRVLLEIVAAAGGRYRGKTKLHKAFWLAHLFHWQEEQGQLTNYPIVRLPNGPCMNDGDDLIAELVREGAIEVLEGQNGPFPEYTYVLSKPFQVDPENPAHRSALKAVNWLRGKSARQVSDLAHEFSRTWRKGSNGDELSIYLDLLSDDQYEAVKQRSAEVAEAMREAFGG